MSILDGVLARGNQREGIKGIAEPSNRLHTRDNDDKSVGILWAEVALVQIWDTDGQSN